MTLFLCWAMATILQYNYNYSPTEVLTGEGSSLLLLYSDGQLLLLLQPELSNELPSPIVVQCQVLAANVSSLFDLRDTAAVSYVTCRVNKQHSDTNDSAVLF